MLKELRNAAAISEFVAGYNGDCGECAELCAIHTTDPARYPLNAAALSTIVKRDISQGWASSNGSEPIGAIASDLHSLGIPFTNDGYAQPFTVDYGAVLNEWGGVKPIILELALAGALPGDEPGVHYHFICCVGWDAQAQSGLFADGDNKAAAGGSLVTYTLAQLQAAQVCGLLVVEVDTSSAWIPDSSGAHDTATPTHHVGFGIYGALQAAGLAGVEGASSETYYPDGSHRSFAALADGHVIYWDGASAHLDGATPLLYFAGLYAASQQEQQQEQQEQTAEQAAVAELNKATADVDAVVHVSGPTTA